MNFGVVILNYLAYQETINCVEQFLQQDYRGNEFYIVVVDNASPNESYSVLQEKYQGHPKVRVVQCDRNLGFARGNNLGYRELVKHFSPDFFIFSNEDIVLKSPGLIDWILRKEEEYHFAVLGPDVYSVRGHIHQSPMSNVTNSVIRCIIQLLKSNIKTQLIRLYKLKNKPLVINLDKGQPEEHYGQAHQDLTLHGSFQVFSKKYFSGYQEPYDPRTFLYLEEDILRIRCNRKGLLMLYSPEYAVDHLQAVSTYMASTTDYDRVLRRKRHTRHSLWVYIRVLLEGRI